MFETIPEIANINPVKKETGKNEDFVGNRLTFEFEKNMVSKIK